MAKVKKKVELSLEEKLEQVLVPVDERPYEVPENWCWTKIGNISEMISKGTTPRGGKDAYIEDGVRFLRVENILDNGTISLEGIAHITDEMHKGFLKRSILQENDVLVSIAGTLGKTAIIQNDDLPINTNQAVAFIRIKPELKILPKYLRYSLATPVIQNYLLGKTKVTSIPNLTLEIISECPMPMPPVSEQQRIVEQIENLFAKLDEAKEKIEESIEGYEARKAAILYKLFLGELTLKWREENNQRKDDWVMDTLGKYIESQYGYTEKATYEVIGPKFLRITDIQENQVIWSNVPYCRISDEDYERYAIKKGDIVVARTGATTGKSYLIKDEVDSVFASFLIRLVVKSDKLIPEYLYCFMQSQNYWRQIMDLSSGIAQPGVNSKKFKELEIPIPSIAEQMEMVRVAEKLLQVEKGCQETLEKTLVQIDGMKKSILTKAFRGELGTNNPDEEGAVELLKQILVENM